MKTWIQTNIGLAGVSGLEGRESGKGAYGMAVEPSMRRQFSPGMVKEETL